MTIATTFLVRQHREIEVLLHALENERHSREALLLVTMDELFAHLATEDNLFYPAARRELDASLATHKGVHDDVRRALLALPEAATSDDAFVAQVRHLRRCFTAHVATDEPSLFPRMERALGAPMLAELGDDMESLCSALVNRRTDSPGRGARAPVALVRPACGGPGISFVRRTGDGSSTSFVRRACGDSTSSFVRPACGGSGTAQ
jgi:hypothetical protein